MKKLLFIIFIVIILAAVGLGGYFIYQKYFIKKSVSISGFKISNSSVSVSGEPVFFTNNIENSKFGFLVGVADEASQASARGAYWVRPHPGPFLWDKMQKSSDSEISFDELDNAIKTYQQQELGILPTIWPFANWDQQKRENYQSCEVSETDIFLPHKKYFGDEIDYIPKYRCNPLDWQAYKTWIQSVVERYDGDGNEVSSPRFFEHLNN